MSGNLAKLAKLFKERENPFHIPVTTGTVISVSPLQVQWGDSVVLTAAHLVVEQLYAQGFTVQYDDNGTARTLTIQNALAKGDQVILVPDLDYKTWYLVGKVGTVT